MLLVGVRQGAGTVLAFAAQARDAAQPRVQGLALVDPILTVDELQRAGTQDGDARPD